MVINAKIFDGNNVDIVITLYNFTFFGKSLWKTFSSFDMIKWEGS